MRLFHFTCDHSLGGIRDLGNTLRPWGAKGLPQLVWLTDLKTPDRDGLGLTMRLTKCDRTRWRFTTLEPLERLDHVQAWSDARRSFRPTYVEALEHAPGAAPEHWWISRTYIHVSAPEEVAV